MKTSFPLAPMSKSILVLTLVLWLLPFFFLGYSLLAGFRGFEIIAFLLFVLYGGVWLLCRPTGFEVSEDALKIVFPAWMRSIPLQDIKEIEQIGTESFKQRYGLAMRIGVGGLWGGFGWLWTSKGGLVEFYISRSDGLVMVERKKGRNILVTPGAPAGFTAAIRKTMKQGNGLSAKIV